MQIQVARLLQDALEQFRGNFGVALVTNAPRGLFSMGSGSSTWAADEYLEHVRITDVKSVYNPLPLSTAGVFPLRAGFTVAIGRTKARYSSLVANMVPFEESIGPGSADACHFPTLAAAVPGWAITTMQKATYPAVSLNSDALELPGDNSWETWRQIGLAALTILLLEDHEMYQGRGRDMIRKDLESKEWAVDTLKEAPKRWKNMPWRHELAYSLVTTALGRDYEVCKRFQLQLMASAPNLPGSPVWVGLCRINIDLGYVRELSGRDRILTVCINPKEDFRDFDLDIHDLYRNSDGTILYDLIKLDRRLEDRPIYEVFGVWVPTTASPTR